MTDIWNFRSIINWSDLVLENLGTGESFITLYGIVNALNHMTKVKNHMIYISSTPINVQEFHSHMRVMCLNSEHAHKWSRI